jgi:hypothetical protein
VKTGEGDDSDDHSDRGRTATDPVISSVSPPSARQGTSFTITITGANLAGATQLSFPANGNGGDDGNGNSAQAIAVRTLRVSDDGTQVTAIVTIGAAAKLGAHTVVVQTPNGSTPSKGLGAAVFIVQP